MYNKYFLSVFFNLKNNFNTQQNMQNIKNIKIRADNFEKGEPIVYKVFNRSKSCVISIQCVRVFVFFIVPDVFLRKAKKIFSKRSQPANHRLATFTDSKTRSTHICMLQNPRTLLTNIFKIIHKKLAPRRQLA